MALEIGRVGEIAQAVKVRPACPANVVVNYGGFFAGKGRTQGKKAAVGGTGLGYGQGTDKIKQRQQPGKEQHAAVAAAGIRERVG